MIAPAPQSNELASAAKTIAAAGGILMTMQSLSQRGGERVGILLANGFARAGIPVRLALMRDGGEAERELRAVLDERVTIAAAGAALRGLARKLRERMRAVPFIRNQVEAFRPAVVLCTVNSLGLVTARARRRTGGGPSFAMKLTNRVAPPEFGAVRRWYRHKSFAGLLRRFDLVLTLSKAERESMIALYPARSDVFREVPNPYVTEDMLRGPPPRRAATRRLVAAGRMVRQKRFDILLEAFAQSADKSSTLTIVGDGPLRNSLKRLAGSLGIADRVDMPGFADDLIPWLRKSDLFVLSSDYEGLPAVVIEALACGVPVVATNSFESAGELLGGLESCAVTPISDPQRLAEAIDRSLSERADVAALRGIARGYLIEDAIAAHIVHLGRLVERRQAELSKR